MARRKRNRIIDADKLLKKSGFKSPSGKVVAMQEEIRQEEAIAKLMKSLSLSKIAKTIFSVAS